MRALVLYCHPKAESFTAAVRDTVVERLAAAGAEVRLTDLYARNFDPRLSPEEFDGYEDPETNRLPLAEDCADLGWCDTLIFIYPTWWYGLPAMLKGWLDRVLVPGLAFTLPQREGATIGPGLTHIRRIGVFTTCGADRRLIWLVGNPGRRTLLRGIRMLCAPRCRTVFAAHYLMDSSTPESRARHLEAVARKTDRLMR